MANENVDFVLSLIDKASGPAGKIVEGIEGVTGAFSQVEQSTGKISKITRALEVMTIALRGIQIASGLVDLSRAFGGFDGLKALLGKIGAGMKRVGQSAMVALKRVAPFAVGGAGLYGLAKISSALVVPALGAVTAGIGAVGVASLGLLAVTGVVTLAVGALAVKFISAAHDAAEFGQTAKLAMGFITGSAGRAEASFEATRAMAEKLGLNVRDTVGQFKQLLSAQFSVAEATELTKMSADLQVVSGDAQAAGRALLAIRQIFAAGRLQGDELNQLAEAGVATKLVYEQLGKQLGKTVPEVMKLKEAGKIDAVTAITGIKAAVKQQLGVEEFGGAAEAAAVGTIAGMKRVLTAAVENMFISVGTAIEPTLTGLVKRVGDLLKSILKSPALANLGNFLLLEFEYFALWVEAEWPKIQETITGALDLIASAIRMGIDVVHVFIDNWGFVKSVLLGVAVVFGILLAAALVFFSPLIALVAVIGLLIAGIGYAISWLANNAGAMFDAAVAWGQSVVQGIVNGIENGAQWVIDAITGLAGRAAAAFKSVLKIGSPSRVFEDFGLNTVEGFTLGLAANENMAEGATVSMASAATMGAAAVAGDGGGASIGPITLAFQFSGAPPENAEELAEQVVPIIRREIKAMMEVA